MSRSSSMAATKRSWSRRAAGESGAATSCARSVSGMSGDAAIEASAWCPATPFAIPVGRGPADPARNARRRGERAVGRRRSQRGEVRPQRAERRRRGLDRRRRVVELAPVADGQRRGSGTRAGRCRDRAAPSRARSCRWTSPSCGPTPAGARRGPSGAPADRPRPASTGRSRPRGGGRRCRCRRCGSRSPARGSAGPSPSTRGASPGSRRPTGSASGGSGPRRPPSTGRSRPGRACRARPPDRWPARRLSRVLPDRRP